MCRGPSRHFLDAPAGFLVLVFPQVLCFNDTSSGLDGGRRMSARRRARVQSGRARLGSEAVMTVH